MVLNVIKQIFPKTKKKTFLKKKKLGNLRGEILVGSQILVSSPKKT